AVARGDLSKKNTVDVKGEILALKSTINTMVDQLSSFASEVTRVAREVGTEGKLGGQAQVPGVAGTWKDLTDNVNSMAANLTNQVRGIVQVLTAVARGDLKRKVVFETKGEIAALADTINGMIDTLATFADQVTDVAREVGIEGKLGGQAKVPGAAGLWRDLTDNVNQLAQNLTTQVRSIAEVATAVTKGDLTRSITVEAQGEVAALKDNINEMIRNLKDTTRKNTEQDWLKTHLARFTRMLQGHRDLVTMSRLILSELTPLVNAQQAAFYIVNDQVPQAHLELLASYAFRASRNLPKTIAFGEGLLGQCALEKKRVLLANVPNDYMRLTSALGSAPPLGIAILPVLFEGEVKAVIELASFGQFSEIHQTFLDQLTDSIGVVLHTIAANMRTEDLLQQSQTLTAELQSQQQALQKTNDRLEQQALNLQKSETLLKSKQDELRAANDQLQEKARQLSDQMRQVELKNREVEQAKAALEEKAEQLTLSSRYKSEFLANMSHELRTPLNSLLILARLLTDNAGGNMSPKQVEFAHTIHTAGADLLSLINDILDLAKIESGTVTLTIGAERFSEIRDYVERTFRQVARDKGLEFRVSLDHALPQAMQTDGKRVQQVIKNLLSNAFKFTEKGGVTMRIEPARAGWSEGNAALNAAPAVIALSVSDTGIGIPLNKQSIIFEAFHQADGTTSREFGGTGLGLSICRELARLLGGEVRVASAPGKGSTFTLYLPLSYRSAGLPQGEAAMELHAQPQPEPRATFAAPEAEPPTRAAATEAASHLAGRAALLVDDDIRNVFALTSALEQRGLTVIHADNGREGVETLKRNKNIDFVLMDLMMPGLDGYDTIRFIRRLEPYAGLPIIAVTAKAMVGDREKCLEAGATDYVAKPVDVDTLLTIVWRCLQE
ncbi:MAG: response regulator, partial [Betaproteobacteria bacterium]|nr:response regulator [Betaproteobacteria bacterium]